VEAKTEVTAWLRNYLPEKRPRNDRAFKFLSKFCGGQPQGITTKLNQKFMTFVSQAPIQKFHHSHQSLCPPHFGLPFSSRGSATKSLSRKGVHTLPDTLSTVPVSRSSPTATHVFSWASVGDYCIIMALNSNQVKITARTCPLDHSLTLVIAKNSNVRFASA
jgi:hypothetical protein